MEYNAVGKPNLEAATQNISTFNARIISLIVKLVFRHVYNASTSIPSTAHPARIVNPIPTPRKKPPKTETSSLSEVTAMWGIRYKQIPRIKMQRNVLSANL